jgi:type VI secretion system protein ImpL
MSALLALQGLLEQIANTPGSRPDNPLIADAAARAGEAKLLTRQISQSFKADPLGRVDATVQKLLEDPITNAEALVRNVVPGELNGQGRAFCSQVQAVMSKYPFTPTASAEATLQEMGSIFHPQQGALVAFFNATLSKYLTRQGASFVVNPEGGVRINPVFLSYWNRVSAFSEAVYPANAAAPRVPLTMRLQRAPSVQNVTLAVEGQSRTSSGSSPSQMQFIWTGSGRPVTLSARIGGSEFFLGRYDGPWALFRFFGDSENWTTTGGTTTFERTLRQGQRGTPVTLRDGSRLSLIFELNSGRVQMFQKDFFAGMRCVPNIALP